MGRPVSYVALAVLVAAFGFTTYQVKRSEMEAATSGGG